MGRLKFWAARFGVGIGLLLILPLVWTTFTYFNFDPNFGFLRIKKDAVQSGWYLPFYYLHVLPAGLILLAGLFQVFSGAKSKYRNAHRCLGKFYIFAVLLLVAPGAMGMSFFIGRGRMVFLSFLSQNLLWFGFTWLAFKAIKAGNLDSHRKWAIRSYALAFAAVTLRLYVFIFNSDFELSTVPAYATIAWASWLGNLLVAEIYLKGSRI
mgnify:CR=1 FL=1